MSTLPSSSPVDSFPGSVKERYQSALDEFVSQAREDRYVIAAIKTENI